MKWAVIDGCPCPRAIAPYVYIVLRDAGQTASSIYRGNDPAAVRILHAHGKHTQAEIHAAPATAAISNPPGFSQHELRSDGVGNPHVPRGGRLHWWQVGIDSGTNDKAAKDRVTHAARKHGWHVKHPYASGVEGHHWCFSTRPRPHSLRMRLRIAKLRATLPRR